LHVSNVSGVRIAAKDLCSIARKNGILSLVDGAQTFGTLPLDLHDIGCDFFTASSHKWFCGPKEVGILYVRRDQIESLYPSQVGVGWETAVKEGARKFDNLGQQDDSRVSAMFEAAQFHNTLGKLRISSRARMLADDVKEGLKKRIPNIKFVTPIDHTMCWGVVVFDVPGLDSRKALDVLYGQHGIGCAAMGPRDRESNRYRRPAYLSVTGFAPPKNIPLKTNLNVPCGCARNRTSGPRRKSCPFPTLASATATPP